MRGAGFRLEEERTPCGWSKGNQMDKKPFYHISPVPLEKDTILTNGLYGQKIRDPQFIASNYFQHIKEEIFEEVRAIKYPTAPSRLNSVFLCPDLIAAKFYRSTWHKYKSFIYEIEVLEGEPFIVDMHLLECNGFVYGTIKSCAEKYWQLSRHQDSCTLEAILNGKALVRQLISSPSIIL